MFKTELQIAAGELLNLQPTYDHVKEGQDHNPRFKATVTVGNDMFESRNFCRTLKEAQDSAAEVAYRAVAQKMIQDDTFHGKFAAWVADRALTQRTTEDDTSRVMHKNMLQQFAMKHGLSLPVYSSSKEGPMHRPQFKSSVTINGQTYSSEECFSNLRSAEQAAAAIALETLSKKKFRGDDVHNDFDHCKNLLVQKAQKERLPFPKYESTISGPMHMPSFISIVYFMGNTYEGAPAKSKKQAEKNAAKVAWDAITYGSDALHAQVKWINLLQRLLIISIILSSGALTPASALISGNTYSQLRQNAVSPASIQRISSSTSGIRLVHAEAPRQ